MPCEKPTYIHYGRDDVFDPDARWIISEQRSDDDDFTVLLVLEADATRDDARRAAQRFAVERGLPFDGDGEDTEPTSKAGAQQSR